MNAEWGGFPESPRFAALNEEELILAVHNCVRCHLDKRLPRNIIPERCYPVYSFGEPALGDSGIVVVGVNPSRNEYEKGHLSDSMTVEDRIDSQKKYFERQEYRFFKAIAQCFDGEAKKAIGWTRSPWDHVRFLDLVKCVTVKRVNRRGKKRQQQWSGIKHIHKEVMIGNCQNYLIQQLKLYRPKLIVAYGLETIKWFKRNPPPKGVELVDLMQGQAGPAYDDVMRVQKRVAQLLRARTLSL